MMYTNYNTKHNEMKTAYDEDIWSENADEETNAKLIEMLKEVR